MPEPASDEERIREAPGRLWEQLRADPSRAPEHLALQAAELHGPAARDWERKARATYSMSNHDLARMAKSKHASLARIGGAATGFGGFVTVLPDLVALAWIQSRLVFYVAASFGYDPLDRMRPAELLVLQEIYTDPLEARTALDGAGTRVIEAAVRNRMGGDQQLATKLAKMVGKRVGKRAAGRLVPGFAVLFNAVSNERDTRKLADRAIAFYGGATQPPAMLPR